MNAMQQFIIIYQSIKQNHVLKNNDSSSTETNIKSNGEISEHLEQMTIYFYWARGSGHQKKGLVVEVFSNDYTKLKL